MQNSINSAPITTMANSGHMVNSNSHAHDSSDMDIEMEDVDKNDMGKENGLPSKEKDDRSERRRDRPSRFERTLTRSPQVGEDKICLVERLRTLASGGDMEPRDRYDRDRQDRDQERGRDMHERDDRVLERDHGRDLRARESNRFGPDAFNGPPPGFLLSKEDLKVLLFLPNKEDLMSHPTFPNKQDLMVLPTFRSKEDLWSS
nr:uncharacterized protein LOC128688598 [Cherax quadricarinatus]